jgi:ATP-dependent Clp protease ATP-binding subunit ClpC
VALAEAKASDEFETLLAECANVEQSLAAPQWDALKQRLSQGMSTEEFWKKPERYDALARLALMDRVQTVAGTAASLRARLARQAGQPRHYSRELVSRLSLQLWLIKQGVQDVLQGAAIEIALVIEPALEAASSDNKEVRTWCRQLWGMYRAWADRRHMQVEEISASRNGEPPILLITGFGAERVLAAECGLHILEMIESGNASNRATARVRLVATPLQDLPPAKLHDAIIRAFEKAPRASDVVRRYRGEPSPLVRNADGTWRTGRLDAVLRGDFDLLPAAESR